MEGKHVFISYSRKDRSTLERIRQALVAAEIPVWTDAKISPGTPQWSRSIEAAVKEACVIIVLMSPDANASEWVNIEISLARNHEITILPILLSGGVNTAVPPSLVNYQFIDFTRGWENAIETLVQMVKHIFSLALVPVDKHAADQFSTDQPTPFARQSKFQDFVIKTWPIGLVVLFAGAVLITLLQPKNLGGRIDQVASETAALILIHSSTPTATNSTIASANLTPTAPHTLTPETTNKLTHVTPTQSMAYESFGQDILDNCISTDFWSTSVGRPEPFPDRPRCLDLTDFGYQVSESKMEIFDPHPLQGLNSKRQFERGYLSFDVRIFKLEDPLDLEPRISFGIVNSDNPKEGLYFAFLRKSNSENFLRGIWFNTDDNGDFDSLYSTNLIFNTNEIYNLGFDVQNRLVNIELNGIVQKEELPISFSAFDLSITHSLKESSLLRISVSNFKFSAP